MHKNKKKYIILLFSICALAIAIIIAILSLTPNYSEDDYLNLYKENLVKMTEQASQIIDYYYALAGSGELEPEEAKERAINHIRQFRYRNSGYFWILDYEKSILVMHPIFPDIEGRELTDIKNISEEPVGELMLDAVAQNEDTFIYYNWPRNTKDEIYKKISHVKMLPHWGWAVGTGFYLEDLQKHARLDFIISYIFMLGFFLLILLIISVITYMIFSDRKK